MNENKNNVVTIDPKKVVHYYVDGGVKQGVAVSAFLRKSYFLPTKEEWRRYPRSKGFSSTDAEIRAIELAIQDALATNLDLKLVVIHTDQKAIAFKSVKNKSSKIYKIVDRLINLGIITRYDKSIHSIEEYSDLDLIPKRELNPYLVHKIVNSNFKTMNRFQIHRLRKDFKKKKEGLNK